MEGFFEKYKISYMVYNEIMDEKYCKNNYLYSIIQEYGGSVFNKGLFKIHTFDYIKKWTKLIIEHFSEELNLSNMVCFASNWQEIMYCINDKNEEITYFSPAKHEHFSKNVSLEQFFDKILIDKNIDIISEEYFYKAYKSMKIIELDYGDSIIGKSNYERISTEALWKIK